MNKKDIEQVRKILKGVRNGYRSTYDLIGYNIEDYYKGWDECWLYFEQELEYFIRNSHD